MRAFFMRSLISCVRLAILRETKRKYLPLCTPKKASVALKIEHGISFKVTSAPRQINFATLLRWIVRIYGIGSCKVNAMFSKIRVFPPDVLHKPKTILLRELD